MTVRRASAAVFVCAAAALSLTAFGGSDVARAGSPGPAQVYAPPPAQDDFCADAIDGAECLVVLVDHLKALRLEGDVESMLIGNPAVADVNMLSNRQAVISARSVGSTNVLFLGADEDAVAHYQIIVREPDLKRVTLRRGPRTTELYQCAPRCERTLTQNDTLEQYENLRRVLEGENSVNGAAIGDAPAGEVEFDSQ